VSSCPWAKPKSKTRQFAVLSKVRLTIPFGANLVSSVGDRTFAEEPSQTGFSFTPAI
jgi:hypothetical protein